MRDVVPPRVLNRRTLGFPVPIRHWLRTDLHDWARAVVLESQTDELINRNTVLRLLDEHRAGTINHSRRIWALIVFMIWHGIFIEDRIKPEIPEPHYPIRL
jgi:asparagine synthase (glutamine-hydrolysing)